MKKSLMNSIKSPNQMNTLKMSYNSKLHTNYGTLSDNISQNEGDNGNIEND